MTEPLKRCPRCDQRKRPTAFYVNRKAKDGRSCYCKSCQQQLVAERKAAEPDKVRLSSVKAHIKRKYAMTWEEYLDWYNRQAGNCKICGTHFPLLILYGLHVDHCHKTGRIRGLLCRDCNTGIGLLKDDPDRLQAAIAYLKPEIPSGEN